MSSLLPPHDINNPLNIFHTLPLSSFKLDRSNYLSWQLQFLSFLNINDLLGFLEGFVLVFEKTNADNSPNPSYTTWYKKDQTLLGIILSFISPNIVGSVYSLNTSK